MTGSSVDVVIIGAGAAGLAAARELHDSGLRVDVLEARDRIGGRILTHREPGTPDPIELGAEFIHGDADETQAVLDEAGLRSVDIEGRRLESQGGRLRVADDFWQRLHRVMRLLPTAARDDQTFREFLDRQPGGRREAHNRRLALQFVEGFMAADADRVSSHSMAGNDDPTGDPAAQRMGRVVDGYDRLIDALAKPLARSIRRSTVVTRVRWKPGRVEIESRSASDGRKRPVIRAARAIVTVPLGVLQAPFGAFGSIAFDPPLDGKATAIAGMAMGSIVRVVLRFKTRFWTEDSLAARAAVPSLESLTFIQSDDDDFPVWWTQYPVRTPVFVGWRGGPKARALDRLAPIELTDRAVTSLARACRLPPRRLQALLAGSWTHHWDSDPLSRGAYSYQLVGGTTAPADLARPVRGTLYFAGEATAPDGRLGTVDGAIASGQRAARQVRRALG
jgi:monoamine oxidase